MKNKYTNSQFLSSFILKIIAIIAMTLDHVGLLLSAYMPSTELVIVIFRIIGRLAMPLFCFLIVEGAMRTNSFGKYALRLGIMLTFMAGVLSTSYFCDVPGSSQLFSYGNIYVDLLLGAAAVYCLQQKSKPIKFLSLLPLAISILSMCVTHYEFDTGAKVWWYPFFFRTQFQFYGVLLCIGIYFGYIVKDMLIESKANSLGISKDVFLEPGQEQLFSNIISLIVITIATVLYWFAADYLKFPFVDVQLYAIISGALLLFYNGKKGYNSRVFQYGSYLYYPIHLGILILIYIISTL